MNATAVAVYQDPNGDWIIEHPPHCNVGPIANGDLEELVVGLRHLVDECDVWVSEGTFAWLDKLIATEQDRPSTP